MDPLSAILESMHASAAMAIVFKLSAPFSVGKGDIEGIPFRVCDGAPFWLKVADDDWVRIEAGDLVLLPHGDRHVMASDPLLPVEPLSSGFTRLGLREWSGSGRELVDVREIGFGGAGETSTVVAGILIFRAFDRSPLLDTLPRLIRIRASDRAMLGRLASALQSLLDEAKEAAPGWNIAVCRLAEVIFVQALRAHFAHGERASSGWYEALADTKIGKALMLLHGDLSVDWSVQSLASAIGMSRSRFAARFTELLGMAPMSYQTQIRLSRAAELLARGDPVATVAARAGYASERAFSRAFRNWAGNSPGRYRQINADRADTPMATGR